MTTKNDILATVDGLPGSYRSWEGGGGSAEATLDWVGGAAKPTIQTGPVTYENITLTRGANAATDVALIAVLRKSIGNRYTLKKQALDARRIAVGKVETWPSCVLVGVSGMESEAGSSDVTDLVLEFATPGPA